VDFGKSLYGVRIEDVTLCAGGRGIQNGDIVRLERNGKKIGLTPLPCGTHWFEARLGQPHFEFAALECNKINHPFSFALRSLKGFMLNTRNKSHNGGVLFIPVRLRFCKSLVLRRGGWCRCRASPHWFPMLGNRPTDSRPNKPSKHARRSRSS